MSASGFILLHRSILDWEWYNDNNVKILFIHLLLKANHTERNWKGTIIKRGEFITSLSTLSAETGLTIKEIRNALKKLQKSGELGHEKGTKYTLITINKYDTYQTNDKNRGTKRATNGHDRGTIGARKGQQLINNKELNALNECVAHTPDQIKIFQTWQDWINQNAPRINQLGEPLTIDEILRLRHEYSPEVIKGVMIEMQNYKQLLKKYVNTNLTLRKWIKLRITPENTNDPKPTFNLLELAK